MGYLIPAKELTTEDIKKLRQMALSMLEASIRAQGDDPANYIIRDILPSTDLGFTNEEWKITYSAAYTEETHVNTQLGARTHVVFYGYANNSPDPKTLYIVFRTPGAVKDKVQVEKVYPLMEPVGYFKEPIKFGSKETMQIVFYGKATGDDYPVLLGLIAEPKGQQIAG